MTIHQIPNTVKLESFWMPFTANRQFKAEPRLFASAEGMHYTTVDGRKVIDGSAGLWCVNAGHGRRQIATAVERQLMNLDFAPSFNMGHPLAFDTAFLHAMRPDPKLLRTVLRLGIPAAMGMVVMSLAELVLLGLVNGFGSNATAAYGAVNQVMSYTQFPALSIAISVSIFGAQAIGRGESARVGAIVRTGVEMNLLLTGGLVVTAYLFSRTLMGFFITDAAVLELAQGFTAFYRDCRVVGAEPESSESFRIALCVASMGLIARSLALLGVSAPDAM